MNNIINEKVIEFAERLQLPERAINIDDLPWVPFVKEETCHFKPLRFDLATGVWTYLFKIKGNVTLGRHRHTGGTVIGYNIQGQWKYLEREWTAGPGTFVFEPPGDIHTLTTVGEEEVITLFILGGALQYFDENNQIIGQDDIFTVYKRYCDYCDHHGIPIREDLVY